MRFLALLLATLGLAACTPSGPPGNITGIERVVRPVPPGLQGSDRAEEIREKNRFIEDRQTQFRVTGSGVCKRLRVKFGDGESTILWNADLTNGPVVYHTYVKGPGHWRGPKTFTAEPLTNCTGGATSRDTLTPPEMTWAIGYSPGVVTPTCTPIGLVRAGTVVTARPLNTPELKIRFSAVESRGIAGAPDPALGPPFLFPFPGLPAYSLIFRVGSNPPFPGGSGAPFTVPSDGQLELCINDDLPSDNSGAWGIALLVDETGAP
jgi:hypothetical protein